MCPFLDERHRLWRDHVGIWPRYAGALASRPLTSDIDNTLPCVSCSNTNECSFGESSVQDIVRESAGCLPGACWKPTKEADARPTPEPDRGRPGLHPRRASSQLGPTLKYWEMCLGAVQDKREDMLPAGTHYLEIKIEEHLQLLSRIGYRPFGNSGNMTVTAISNGMNIIHHVPLLDGSISRIEPGSPCLDAERSTTMPHDATLQTDAVYKSGIGRPKNKVGRRGKHFEVSHDLQLVSARLKRQRQL
ncbi:hypothetical protein Bbelb_284600 [Branchiostoma belcheri]|nr:hypothetical protein Bbelb_284600 [Branchiostoma belcheri]